MKVVYLLVLALCMGMAMSLSTRIWMCSRIAEKAECNTTFYDILWKKVVAKKNFSSCVPDQLYNYPMAINCMEGSLPTRIICPTPPWKNGTSGCRIFRRVSERTEIRTYNPNTKCVVPPKITANVTETCNCILRPRINTDLVSKDFIYFCLTQMRLDYDEDHCYTLFPLDPLKVACTVNRLHEIEV